MTHKTKGIVLRTVKYGETSVIVSIFTELFGLQSYLVNGVRVVSKKSTSKASFFQPAAILDLVVYHNELKNLQRLKEFQWDHLYTHIFFHVVKNAVAMFMVELLSKCIKQPESNPDLYHFVEDAFIHLDGADEAVVANYPLFFALHLASFFGLRIQDNYAENRHFLDLREGLFVSQRPTHPDFLEGEYSLLTSELLKVMQPGELAQLKLNKDKRRILLFAFQNFYSFHVQEFHGMKTVPILQTILSN
ncbi:MAG: DNA repair protein RecO [Bacteroidetes bacterium]|nr:MAG: DNA repair protein RecO [Bacteroidota bacterium]